MSKPKPAPAEKAFTKSDKHILDDLLLKPWTAARSIAANSLGMLYPHIGTEGWDQFKRTKIYPGCMKDIAICLYLCTLDDDAVDEADAAPKDAYKAARKWATEKGITKADSIEFWVAYGKFGEIMRQVNESVTMPAGAEQEADDDPGND